MVLALVSALEEPAAEADLSIGLDMLQTGRQAGRRAGLTLIRALSLKLGRRDKSKS